MKHIKITLTCMAAILILSCNKEDKKENKDGASVCAVSDIKGCVATTYETENIVGMTLQYDSQGRVIDHTYYKVKYEPGKIIAYYKPTNAYFEGRLNSSGRLSSIYYGRYNISDSSIKGTLTLDKERIFDEAGNLIKHIGYASGAFNYDFGNGKTKYLGHIYFRFEYDTKGNITKMYRGLADYVTGSSDTEILFTEFLKYDEAYNATSKNETLRFLQILQSTYDYYSLNNPVKVKQYYKFGGSFTDYRYEPWEATYTNIYNQNCYLTGYKYTKLAAGYQPQEISIQYNYSCTE